MSDRISRIELLCEDDAQHRLAIRYMQQCDINTDRVVTPSIASRMQHGGNVAWVLREFPRLLHASRQRSAKAETLLVVLADADRHGVDERWRQLNRELKRAGYEELKADDPVAALLIPRRHIETWICSLLGDSVTEDDDCKGRRKLTKAEMTQAAKTAYDWARPNPVPGPTCVPSLAVALPQWRKIRAQR